ncbi:hypothetical protein Sipo8835_41415 [Streptomyces ipomoeae]|uniref:Uncharacterized protein n=1 Tax=Streptomyces ipomoeae TaxID=103232 RepID=A0AAE8VV22_9ACTN|nr:hypothetical protein [Streptomyces ipomoeae]TQE17859.1 hypothetical protein Sipo8835_41415 [Streptomyces ipomoeae]TQE29243.1 hypothetical protein Sipo7851_28795 [Streptomyces ipomoeae]
MSLPPHPSLFTTVERQWAGRNPVPELRLFAASDGAGVPLALEQVRQKLYDRSVEPAVRTALWHQIAERVRMDADRSDWPSAVVWLGLPGLRRTAFRITWYFRAEREDVEAELVTCYLEALTEVGPHTPDPGGRVLRSACSRAWTVWRRARPEMAVDDVGGVGGIPLDSDTEGPWQVDYHSPAARSGLSADRWIIVPAHRVEGVRIGALAQAWGLAGTAAGTAHSGRGRQVATMSLRRGGRKG